MTIVFPLFLHLGLYMFHIAGFPCCRISYLKYWFFLISYNCFYLAACPGCTLPLIRRLRPPASLNWIRRVWKMDGWMFFTELPVGQFSTHNALLQSHAVVICAECVQTSCRQSLKNTSDGMAAHVAPMHRSAVVLWLRSQPHSSGLSVSSHLHLITWVGGMFSLGFAQLFQPGPLFVSPFCFLHASLFFDSVFYLHFK